MSIKAAQDSISRLQARIKTDVAREGIVSSAVDTTTTGGSNRKKRQRNEKRAVLHPSQLLGHVHMSVSDRCAQHFTLHLPVADRGSDDFYMEAGSVSNCGKVGRASWVVVCFLFCFFFLGQGLKALSLSLSPTATFTLGGRALLCCGCLDNSRARRRC